MFLSAVIVWTNYPQSVIRACLEVDTPNYEVSAI